MSIVDPIGEFQEVTWQQGPLKASDDPQPPNIVLIVVDDLGLNDITFYVVLPVAVYQHLTLILLYQPAYIFQMAMRVMLLARLLVLR